MLQHFLLLGIFTLIFGTDRVLGPMSHFTTCSADAGGFCRLQFTRPFLRGLPLWVFGLFLEKALVFPIRCILADLYKA